MKRLAATTLLLATLIPAAARADSYDTMQAKENAAQMKCLHGDLAVCKRTAAIAGMVEQVSRKAGAPKSATCYQEVIVISTSAMIAQARKDYPAMATLAHRGDAVQNDCPAPYKAQGTFLSNLLQKTLQDAGK